MDAKELRIGNLIIEDQTIYDYGTEKIIREITPIDFSMIGDKYEYEHWDMIKPIELTEEWLLKFGFVKGRFDNYVLILGNEFSKFSYWSNAKYIELSNTSGTTWGSVNCMYLHQLQNLYFALTGEELKIKE